MQYSIITPVYNQCVFTEQYLKNLIQLPANDFEIIIVNNGSTDKTKEILNNYSKKMDGVSFPKLIIYNLDENIGFAKGSNKGYDISNGETIIFLNNDIRTKNNDWYKPVEKELKINGKCLYGPTGGYIDKNYNFKYETNDNSKKINYLSGWCLFGKRKVFEKIRENTPDVPYGPFIERFTTYFEDTYMGFLCEKLKIKQKIIPCPDILHFGRVTSKSLNINKLYISAREKFIEQVKHHQLKLEATD